MNTIHCHVRSIQRSKGSSTCATAAYITGEKIYEERTGEFYDYGRKDRIFDFKSVGLNHVILPKGVPESFNSVSSLANAIENFEEKDDAVCATTEEFSLPVDVTHEEKIAIAKKHIDENWVSKGYTCIWAIHNIDGKNPHCHVIIINRKINERGDFEKTKQRTEYARDEAGNKIPVYEVERDPDGKILRDENNNVVYLVDDTGKKIQRRDKNGKLIYKRITVEGGYMDDRDLIPKTRQNLADNINIYMPEGHKVDPRSYRDQGIERIPKKHVGHGPDKEQREKLNEDIDKYNEYLIQHDDDIKNQEGLLTTLLDMLLSAIERLFAWMENTANELKLIASYDYPHRDNLPSNIQFPQSNDPIIAELQHTYVRRVNQLQGIDELRAMAYTVLWVQQNYSSFAEMRSDFNRTKSNLESARETLDGIKSDLNSLNEQIHYLGMYYANRGKKDETSKSKFARAQAFLDRVFPDGYKTYPSISALKQQKEKVIMDRELQERTVRDISAASWKMGLIEENINAILYPSVEKQVSEPEQAPEEEPNQEPPQVLEPERPPVEIITGLWIRPGQPPILVDVKDNYDGFYAAVNGDWDYRIPFTDDAVIICNKDQDSQPFNRAIYNEYNDDYDEIRGDFLLINCGEDSYLSLTDEQIQKYDQMFQLEEHNGDDDEWTHDQERHHNDSNDDPSL